MNHSAAVLKAIEEMKKEMNIPEIKQLDLTVFIEYQEKHPSCRIGVLKTGGGNFNTFSPGEIVLFRPYTIEEEYMKGTWKEIQERIKFCTIEVPFRDKDKNGRLWTCKTTIYFPISYIDYEIVVKKP